MGSQGGARRAAARHRTDRRGPDGLTARQSQRGQQRVVAVLVADPGAGAHLVPAAGAALREKLTLARRAPRFDAPTAALISRRKAESTRPSRVSRSRSSTTTSPGMRTSPTAGSAQARPIRRGPRVLRSRPARPRRRRSRSASRPARTPARGSLGPPPPLGPRPDRGDDMCRGSASLSERWRSTHHGREAHHPTPARPHGLRALLPGAAAFAPHRARRAGAGASGSRPGLESRRPSTLVPPEPNLRPCSLDAGGLGRAPDGTAEDRGVACSDFTHACAIGFVGRGFAISTGATNGVGGRTNVAVLPVAPRVSFRRRARGLARRALRRDCAVLAGWVLRPGRGLPETAPGGASAIGPRGVGG